MNDKNHQRQADVLDRAIEALRSSRTSQEPPSRFLESTIAVLQSHANPSGAIPLQKKRADYMFRVIRYSKLAAAVILLATAASLVWVLNNSTSSAFGQVVENIKKAATVTFTCKQKIGDTPAYEQKYYGQGDSLHIDGEAGNNVQISNMKTGEALSINHVQKTAVKFKYDRGPDAPVASPLESITSITEKDATLIGEVELDGKKAQLYHLTSIGPAKLGAADKAKIWVDMTNGLPIRIELELVGPENKKASCVFENFKWNVPLNPELFALEVPEGYTVKQGAPVKLMPVKPAVLAFTQVLENMKKATSVSFTTTEYFKPGPKLPEMQRSKWHLQGKMIREEKFETTRKDADNNLPPTRTRLRIVDGETKEFLNINYQTKTIRKRQMLDAKAELLTSMVDAIRTLSEQDAELLGDEELDGRKTQAYRLKKLNPPLGTGKELLSDNTVKLWVDAVDRLPVRLLVNQLDPNHVMVVLDEFIWNKPIDPALFKPELPNNFELSDEKSRSTKERK